MALDSELLSVLPQWIIYSRLVIGLPIAFAATFLGTWVGAMIVLPRRRVLSEMHWSERARVVHPARLVSGYFVLCAPFFFGAAFAAPAGPFNGLPSHFVGGLAALAAFGGATLASVSIHRRTTGEFISWWRHVRNQLLTLIILTPHLLILFVMLATIDGELDGVGIACALGGCVAMTLAALYSGLPLARLLGAVRPASPHLSSLVDEVGRQMDLAPRSVEEVDVGMANAWALPGAMRLVFTPQLVSALDDEGLRGVIAHELGHLKDPLCARVIGLRVLAFLPLGLSRLAVIHYGMVGFVVVYICFIAMLTLSTRLGRRGEVVADAAVAAVDVDTADYARALETLHVENLSPAVMNTRASHPSLYDRMLSAGVEPNFPRPLPPSWIRTGLGSVAAAILMVAIVLALYLPPVAVAAFDTEVERSALTRIAWRGPKARPLFALARQRMVEGRSSEAMVLVEAALELHPTHHAYLAARADLFARAGQCREASEDLDAAVASASDGHITSCAWIERATLVAMNCEQAIAIH